MLSVFPELFNYSFLAPFILRIALAVVLLKTKSGGVRDRTSKTFRLVYVVGAVMILVGFLVQPAALLIATAILLEIAIAKIKKQRTDEGALNVLIFAIAISLALLGSGFLAIDLPL